MNKKVTAIGLSAGLLAGLGAGFVLQNSGSSSAESAIVALAPGADSGSSTGIGASNGTDLASVLAPLVTDGTITQAQADKVLAALQAAGVDSLHDVNGGGMGGDNGTGGRPGMGGGQGGPGMGANPIDTIATTIGISAADLQTGIAGGKTIAEIAVANGSSAQAVIDALVAEVKAHFDAEVKTGEHTQADADQRIADATTQITDFVNNTQNAGMGGPGMGGRGPGDGDGDHHGDGNGIPGGDNGNGGTQGGTIDGGPSDTVAGADA